MRNQLLSVFVLGAILVTASFAMADAVVDGVFGLSTVEETTSIAVWLPLDSETSISGVRWYNNDGDTVFPELLAIAGVVDQPEHVSEATIVGTSVVGVSSGWSEFMFSGPLGSATSGLFVVFRLPAGSIFEDEGLAGGTGFGYWAGDGIRKCWITGDGEQWHPLSADFQIAVEMVVNQDKSADVLVLGSPIHEADEIDPFNTIADHEAFLVAAPNPFNPQTEIRFSLPEECLVNLSIFDIRGRLVKSLREGTVSAGPHVEKWDGRDNNGLTQSSGVFLVRLIAGGKQISSRITLVR